MHPDVPSSDFKLGMRPQILYLHFRLQRIMKLNRSILLVCVLTLLNVTPVRVLGNTSHFNVEAFFGSLVVSTFMRANPANMEKFLVHYLCANDPKGGARADELLSKELKRQKQDIAKAISEELSASKQ